VVHDFKLLPRCKWDLRSSVMLRSVVVNEVQGQLYSAFIKQLPQTEDTNSCTDGCWGRGGVVVVTAIFVLVTGRIGN
jgi:hypothetical protein